MAPVKTVSVHRFVSRPSSSQRAEPGLDQARSQINKGANKKRSKDGAGRTAPFLLKVQLAKPNHCALVIKEDKTPTERTLEPAATKYKTVDQEKQTQSNVFNKLSKLINMLG